MGKGYRARSPAWIFSGSIVRSFTGKGKYRRPLPRFLLLLVPAFVGRVLHAAQTARRIMPILPRAIGAVFVGAERRRVLEKVVRLETFIDLRDGATISAVPESGVQ